MVPHIAEPRQIWLDPWQDATDKGYQLVQSIYAISGGGSSARASVAAS